MADSTPTTATTTVNEAECLYQRTVSLYNWWLVRAKNDFQGKRLAVAGVSSRKNKAMRVFVSAPIIKRYDLFSLETADGKYVIISGFINEQRTLENGFSPELKAMRVFVSAPIIKRYDLFSLETADGKYVIISGFINEQRTLENGFSPEVFNHFLFGFPASWESCALDCFIEESTTGSNLGSAVPHIVSASCPEILSDGVEKSVPTSPISPEEPPGDHQNSFSENVCNVSKEMGGVNEACSSRERRRSSRLHAIKVCQQKKQPASGDLPKHPDNENSASVDLENCDVERLRSPATPIQPQLQSEFSKDACMGNSIPISLVSPEDAPRDHEKQFPENECNVSRRMGGVNFACSSGGRRRSIRLQEIKVWQQKKQPASGGSLKHPDNENSTSVDLEKCDVEGLTIPATPIQSQPQRQLSTPSEQLAKKSASRVSRTLPPKTKHSYKKIRATVETKTVTPKGKLNKSASAGKNPREKDKGNQQKVFTSPQSLSFRKSRSGRLLLPPLEFWRNQIPIYNADHELTEIQDGESLISPCRGSSPSLRRFDSQKHAA